MICKNDRINYRWWELQENFLSQVWVDCMNNMTKSCQILSLVNLLNPEQQKWDWKCTNHILQDWIIPSSSQQSSCWKWKYRRILREGMLAPTWNEGEKQRACDNQTNVSRYSSTVMHCTCGYSFVPSEPNCSISKLVWSPFMNAEYLYTKLMLSGNGIAEKITVFH